MTQAPTPGPLSGDWPVVTDKWVETYCDLTGRDPDGGSVTFLGDGPVSTSFRDAARREIEAMLCAAPKSAIRSLAPTAPVEASGSEDLAGKLTAIRDKFLIPTPDKDFTDYAIITRCIAALRPQPSGETRDAVAWPHICDGVEQPAFETWAKSEGFDMNEHPIHYIFTDPETAAARIAWKAGLTHAVERLKAALITLADQAKGGEG